MTNTKTRKTGGSCGKSGNVSTDESDGENDHQTHELQDMQWMEDSENEYFVENNNGDTDDDDIVNDGETSTSFSLQECMNEFRARRIRRTSLSHHRQDNEKKGNKNSKNSRETAELELINQNLCNKEQERKCKPCQNGFCYCFTSDSGDGGANLGSCNSTRGIHTRYSRRNRRSDCKEADKNAKNSRSKERCTERTSQVQKSPELKSNNSIVKDTTVKTNQLTAISSLETSTRDAPLIHIIQELRENCVISKVRVNKHKIQPYQNKEILKQKKTQFKDQKKPIQYNLNKNKTVYTVPEVHIPTAPTLETFSELDSPQTRNAFKTTQLEKNKKCSECSERRRSAGGQLLQKRLSTSQFNYKFRNIKEAPPKPPRTTRIDDDKCCGSSASTSASVREAERVVDDFLTKKGYKVILGATSNKSANSEVRSDREKSTKKIESAQRKSYPSTPKNMKTQTESILLTYPTLSDMERVAESKKSPLYGKNIRPVRENVTKVTSIGWNETKINDMLNYDANTEQKGFHSTATQAQPQEHPSCDVIGNDNKIGWQVPPKINLDTVDGFVRHNLASNVEDKNTPVKTKITFPSKKGKDGSRKFIWSEQLKHLSPWSNKYNMNDANDSKSNVFSSSKDFIKSSKKKFLRLVSPKKENRARSYAVINKTPHRTVGVQTSNNNSSTRQLNIHTPYEERSSPQSPPGSYHSPIQSSTQSQNTTPNATEPALTRFNFSRTVHSPPKKAPRSSQRKLNFPLNCTLGCKEDTLEKGNHCTTPEPAHDKKTYRSYNSELDHDVSISKISYILSNIRAKLEANDEQAVRTFLETERISDSRSTGFDCPDSHHCKTLRERIDQHEHKESTRKIEDNFNDPIYSEIEDDSVHISESPNFDNTAIQNCISFDNPEVLYAKVNKSKKQKMSVENKSILTDSKPEIPLAKIMQDSFKSKKIISNITLLPPLPEPPGSESDSYASPMPLLHCHSLNNVRVMEHNSPPKNQRNLSKSDLSLHRSEIFLENLCRSELVVDAGIEHENLEKVENVPNRSYISMTQPSPNDFISTSSVNDQDLQHNDTVSYELPNNYDDVDGIAESIDEDNSTTAGSNLGLSTIVPPSSNNQSTPKKQSFTTKDNLNSNVLDLDMEPINISENTPHKQKDLLKVDKRLPTHSLSMNEVSVHEILKNPNIKPINAFPQYKSFKNVLQKSFRKSKSFIRAEGKRLSTSLNFSTNNATGISARGKSPCTDSNLNLEALFSLNESASVNEQIAQAVSICRKLPDLEISSEMVEAERLLLFSALRRENHQILSSTRKKNQSMKQKPKMRFFIDDMYLPVLSDVNQDIFFNYFYIITFECGGVIKSTQSAECLNGTALFRDCGIEFVLCSELETNMSQDAVKCNIFMLRLRKISTISSETRKRTIVETFTQSPSSTLMSTSSSSSSFNEVVSRFRLHASFTINAKNFVPYEYVHQESTNSDRICIRASSICPIPLIRQTKYTNLSGELRLKGRAEVRFPKRIFHGFLNVEDPQSQHNWNRRWCALDGIFMYVWQDENSLNVSPLMVLDLRDTKRNMKSPLTSSPRELCARPRSFCLECTLRKTCEEVYTATVFFAAETQDNLDDWLKNLNNILDFIVTWL